MSAPALRAISRLSGKRATGIMGSRPDRRSTDRVAHRIASVAGNIGSHVQHKARRDHAWTLLGLGAGIIPSRLISMYREMCHDAALPGKPPTLPIVITATATRLNCSRPAWKSGAAPTAVAAHRPNWQASP